MFVKKLDTPKKINDKRMMCPINSPIATDAPRQNPLVKVLRTTSKKIGPGMAAMAIPMSKLSKIPIL